MSDQTIDSDVYERLAAHFRSRFNESSEAQHYAERIGLNSDLIERHEIGFALDKDWSIISVAGNRGAAIEAGMIKVKDDGNHSLRFRNRLMVPIRDGDGSIRGFAGRDITGNQNAKWLNSPASDHFDKSQLLYGWDRAQDSDQTLVITEGYTDQIACEASGLRAVATMGVALSTVQAQTCAQASNDLVVCYDGDERGQTEAENNAFNLLTQVPRSTTVRILKLPPEHDPHSYWLDYGAEALQRYVEAAPDVIDSMITRSFSDGTQNSSVDDRIGSRARLAHIIEQLRDPYRQTQFIDRYQSRVAELKGPDILNNPNQSFPRDLINHKAIDYLGDSRRYRLAARDDSDPEPQPEVPMGTAMTYDTACQNLARAVFSQPDVSTLTDTQEIDLSSQEPALVGLALVAHRIQSGESMSRRDVISLWQSRDDTAPLAQTAMRGGIMAPALAKGNAIAASRLIHEMQNEMEASDSVLDADINHINNPPVTSTTTPDHDA